MRSEDNHNIYYTLHYKRTYKIKDNTCKLLACRHFCSVGLQEAAPSSSQQQPNMPQPDDIVIQGYVISEDSPRNSEVKHLHKNL